MKQIIFTTILALTFGISAFAQNEKSNCPKIEVNGANPNGAGVLTKIWIVLPGAENPQP